MSQTKIIKVSRLEEIEYGNLRGFEKAAILVNYLGPEATRKFFKSMDDTDIRKLLTLMRKFRVIPVNIAKRVLEEFYGLISESDEYIFSQKSSSKETIVEALGEDRARGIMGQIIDGGSENKTLESLELVDSKSLANFLINEHPQTVSLILAHLDTEKKGEVLKKLPESLQSEVVLRMAQLDHVAPELIDEVDRVLRDELSNIGGVEQSQLGGVQTVAEMLNMMDKNMEKAIMSKVEEKNPLLAEEIRKLMFVFDDIIKIDDRGIQSILKEVSNDKLLLSLKTATPEIKDKIFKNISKRAAEMLADDLSTMGPVRISDVESAQLEIVNTIRKMEQEGKVIIATGGEDALV